MAKKVKRINPEWAEAGERIKAAIKERKMKQVDVALKIGFTPQWFNDICSGRAKLQTDAAKSLGKELGVDWLWLIGESDSPNVEDRLAEMALKNKELAEEYKKDEDTIVRILARHGLVIDTHTDGNRNMKCTIDGKEYPCPSLLFGTAIMDDILGYIGLRAELFKGMIKAQAWAQDNK